MDRDFLIQLTNNLYKLTILFPKKEPLRYKMRELADDILSGFLRIEKHSNPSLKTREDISLILEDLEILDTFFAIAQEQNWVSPQNILPVWEEYSKIKEYIGEANKENQKEKAVVARREKEGLNNRQEKILEILKEKGKARVGEFKDVFPEVTKRTLRRDFWQLLRDGKVERIGERNETYYQVLGRT